MSRVKRSVHARKKRRATLARAKGYRGDKHSSYKRAKEQLLKSDSYAYRDRRNKKRDFRRLWITRINAAARLNGLSYSRLMAGLKLAEVEVEHFTVEEVEGITAGGEGANGVFFPSNAQGPSGDVQMALGVKGIVYFEMEAKGGAWGGPTRAPPSSVASSWGTHAGSRVSRS